MIKDLFADDDLAPRQWRESIVPGAVVLRGFANNITEQLLADIAVISRLSPFRHQTTPGGHRMSVGMTSCGEYGWVSDESGYRYTKTDPETKQQWPAMPSYLGDFASFAANEAGFVDFKPDACLINRYELGARMALHQDRNERDLSQPVVSISLGLSANFIFGGLSRHSPYQRFPLTHGDVLVWGAAARLNFPGVAPLQSAIPPWPLQEALRFNLTFRRVSSH